MNNMTITFKKVKHKDNEYLIIFSSFEFPDNIIIYFELSLNNLKKIMEFISKLQKNYNIFNYEIKLDSKDILINYDLDCILRNCPF